MRAIRTAIAGAALIAAMPFAACAQEAERAPPTELGLAREIIDNGFPPETRMDLFTGFVDQLTAQMLNTAAGLRDDPKLAAALERHRERVIALSRRTLEDHLGPLMDSMALAYADTFTRAELEGLHAFVTSPAGHGFLARSMEINSHPAFAEANQAYMNDYMEGVPALQDQLRADVTRIMQERQSDASQ
ncbi:DUF2059 domain-containing protein [Aurantiacibacter spongiae]|nr:DUF2059 domain-containing protein [Aurantiacibacter spongiae]